MDSKKRKTPKSAGTKRILILMLFLFISVPLCFAQIGGDYYIERTAEGINFRQRLYWPEDEYALQYEVIVERRGGENWTEVFRTVTEDAFADFTVRPDEYRYRVVVYNLLGQAEHIMGPAGFRVIPAFQPEIDSFSPKKRKAARSGVVEIVIEGKNILSESNVYLYQENRSKDKNIPPMSYAADPSGNRAVLEYGAAELKKGAYTICIENPGGLNHAAGPFLITSAASGVGIAAWSPFMPLYGFMNDVYDAPFYPLAFQGRLEYFPVRKSWGDAGIEGVLGINWLDVKKNGAEFHATVPYIMVNALYQKELTQRFDFRARAGFGMSCVVMSISRSAGAGTAFTSSLIPAVDTGVSIAWKINPSFYGLQTEFGVDYIHFLSSESPPPGYLRPFIGIGFAW